MDKIIDNIFLGDHSDARNLSKLLENNIMYIINCAPDIPCYFEDRFKYLHLHLIPDQIFDKQLKDKIVEFIDDNTKNDNTKNDNTKNDNTKNDNTKNDNTKNGNVLVHCHEGRERSPSVIILYFMSKGMVYHEAYNLVKMKRTQIEIRIKDIAKKSLIDLFHH